MKRDEGATHNHKRVRRFGMTVALATLGLGVWACGGDDTRGSHGSDVQDVAADADGSVEVDGGAVDVPVDHAGHLPDGAAATCGPQVAPGTPGPVVPTVPGYLHGVVDASDFEASLCGLFCHFGPHCNDDWGTSSECQASCMELVDTGRAANAACYVANCRAREVCLGPEPLPVPGECETACENVATCPGLAVFGLSLSKEACVATCAARAAAYPSFGASLPCFAGKANQCALDDALACLADGAVFCGTLCLEVGGCDPESPFGQVYDSQDECFAECAARGPVGAFKANLCFERLQCEATLECMDSEATECASYIEAVAEVCDIRALWPQSVELIGAMCLPQVAEQLAVHGGDFSYIPACVEQIGCGGAKLPCLYPTNPRCRPLCERLCQCGFTTYAECMSGCGELVDDTESAGVFEQLEACMSGPCSLLGVCLEDAGLGVSGGEHNTGTGDPCVRSCEALDVCGALGDETVSGCQLACANSLKVGDLSVVGLAGCYESAGCDGLASCRATPPATLDACFAACDAAGATCHHINPTFDNGLGACTSFCSGIIAARGLGLDAAECIVSRTDHDCLMSAEGSCW